MSPGTSAPHRLAPAGCPGALPAYRKLLGHPKTRMQLNPCAPQPLLDTSEWEHVFPKARRSPPRRPVAVEPSPQSPARGAEPAARG